MLLSFLLTMEQTNSEIIARVLVHVQNFFFGGGGGWQAVSLGGGVTVMENRKFWQGG